MDSYDFKNLESKWQTHWDNDGLARCDVNSSNTNFYNLCMYPYPSGDLHMGHIRNYTIGDVITRYKQKKMGFKRIVSNGLGLIWPSSRKCCY